MAGTDSGVQLAMTAARPGGRVVLGGIPGDDWIRFQASVARRKGLTIAASRSGLKVIVENREVTR